MRDTAILFASLMLISGATDTDAEIFTVPGSVLAPGCELTGSPSTTRKSIDVTSKKSLISDLLN